MKFSLSSFVYFNFTLAEAIRRTARLGYDGIDIWGGRPHAFRDDLNRSDLRSVRSLLRRHKLTVASFIPAQFRYPTSLCSKNNTIRSDSIAYVRRAVEMAAALDAAVVSVCPGHTVFGQGVRDGWMRLADSLDIICCAARKLGISIAIEPADRYETDLINTTGQAMQMIAGLPHENLGVVLDNGHAHVIGESCEAAIRKMGKRWLHVHVNDNNGKRDQHLIPGRGNFDFADFKTALERAGYHGFLTAELSWDYTLKPDLAARASLAFLRRSFRRK